MRRRFVFVLGLWVGGLVAAGLLLAIVEYRRAGVPTVAGPAPVFVKETATAGIEHSYAGEFPYFVGGGVAVFDCNADYLPDLFFAGGSNPSALFRNESPLGGHLVFSKVAGPATELTAVTGGYPIDVDSDGHVDLSVLRAGQNVMLRGLGGCRFETAPIDWGIDGGDFFTVGFSATWESGSSWPTMVFGNYLELDEGGQQTGRCSDHQLFRPREVGYEAPEVLAPGYCTLSILFSDWDRSGRRDLRITNDRHYYRDGDEQLWRFEPGEPVRLYTPDDGWQPMQIWGMGIATRDLTGDGRAEVFLTSQGDNKLQTLEDVTGAPRYADMAFSVGATAHRPYAGDINLPSTAWHPQFEDVNNDGLVDLFVSKGNVEADALFAARDPNNLLLGNPDASFTEAAETAGIVDFGKSRGAGVVDLNLDGLLDLIVVVRRENVAVWRNTGPTSGNWLAVRARQPGSNRDAIGAWVEVKVGRHLQERELTVGGGHAGGILGWTHFGLGKADSAQIRVQWPDGEKGPWMKVDSDRFFLVDRDASAAMLWQPPG